MSSVSKKTIGSLDRVTVRLTPAQRKGIDEILANTPASNDSEVVRRAITNYIRMFAEVRTGANIISEKTENGVTTRKPVFL